MKSVYLRCFELDDAMLTYKWRSKVGFYKPLVGNKLFTSLEKEKKWIEEKIFNNQQEIYWAICSGETNAMLGYMSIKHIDWRNRQVEWGGLIIGEVENHHKGYGFAATQLMLDYVFGELGMHRIYGYWLESNVASIQLALKIGFVQEGVLRQVVFKNNRFHNLLLLSKLKEEHYFENND